MEPPSASTRSRWGVRSRSTRAAAQLSGHARRLAFGKDAEPRWQRGVEERVDRRDLTVLELEHADSVRHPRAGFGSHLDRHGGPAIRPGGSMSDPRQIAVRALEE